MEVNIPEAIERSGAKAEQKKEKRMKRIEDNLRGLWDNIKRTNIRIIGVPEEEEKMKRTEKIFEEITLKTCLIWKRK